MSELKQAVKTVKELINIYGTVEAIGATPDSRIAAGKVVAILKAGLLAFEDEAEKND